MEVYRYNNKIPLPLIKNDQNTLENMEENLMEHNLRVCLHCLMGIESREGKQFTKELWIDPDDAKIPCANGAKKLVLILCMN